MPPAATDAVGRPDPDSSSPEHQVDQVKDAQEVLEGREVVALGLNTPRYRAWYGVNVDNKGSAPEFENRLRVSLEDRARIVALRARTAPRATRARRPRAVHPVFPPVPPCPHRALVQ